MGLRKNPLAYQQLSNSLHNWLIARRWKTKTKDINSYDIVHNTLLNIRVNN